MSLTACGSDDSANTQSGQSGVASSSSKEKLVLGRSNDIEGWDPSNQPGYQGWAGEAVWDTLVKCDATAQLEPDIAESWEISEDNKTFTGHIREGIKFSDGSPLTSEDVAATFQFVGDNGGAAGDYAGITTETPDDNTIVITWPEPQALIRTKTCAPKITSKALIDSGNVNDVPVGSGPYVLDTDNTTRGSIYAFTKNQDHWNADHYPYEQLEIRVIPSETGMVSALKTGQINGALVAESSLPEIEASDLSVARFNGQTTRLLLTDHNGEIIPELGDLKVRQAINMVFDKDAMVESLFGGNAVPTAQVFREGSEAYIEGLEDPYPFDVEKAKKLMSEAGFADGFTIQLPTMEGMNFETTLPYVSQQLSELNITVEEVPLTGANAIDDLLSGKYPVVFWPLGNLGESKQQIYVEMSEEGYWNLEHQHDDYVDSRWSKMPDATPEEAVQLQQEINQYVVDQAWFAPMVYNGTYYAHSADVSIPTESDIEALAPKLRDFQ